MKEVTYLLMQPPKYEAIAQLDEISANEKMELLLNRETVKQVILKYIYIF